MAAAEEITLVPACLPAHQSVRPSVCPSIYRDHHRTLVFTVLPAEVSFIKTLPARLVADRELWSLYCGKTWGDNFPTEINNMYRPWRSMILKRRAGCTIYETIIQNVCVCDERESHKHRLIKCNVGEIWNEKIHVIKGTFLFLFHSIHALHAFIPM